MRSIVLHSGGLDSTVCLLEAMTSGRDVLSLGINHGQRNRIELSYAEDLCKRFRIPRRVLHVEWDKPVRAFGPRRTLAQIRQEPSQLFLPGRNIVLLSLAVAEAAGMDAEEVWIGINAIDCPDYPDCRPNFLERFRAMISEGLKTAPQIVAPLLDKSKRDIVRDARRLGLNREDTWSCYNPQSSGADFRPCDACDACVLNSQAWSTA